MVGKSNLYSSNSPNSGLSGSSGLLISLLFLHQSFFGFLLHRSPILLLAVNAATMSFNIVLPAEESLEEGSNLGCFSAIDCRVS